MAQLNEKADYNNTGDFDSFDLDISWAYLQIKKLYQLEQAEIEAGTLDKNDATITSTNFRKKVYDQYALNKEAGIAEETDLEPAVLPGLLSDGLPFTLKQPNLVKHWACNDFFNDEEPWQPRSVNGPTSFMESIEGGRDKCVIVGNVGHHEVGSPANDGVEKSGNLYGFWEPATRVKFYDDGKISNKNFCLHFKVNGLSTGGYHWEAGGTQNGDVPLFYKSNVDWWQPGLGFGLTLYDGTMGIYADGSPATNWLGWPVGTSMEDYKWKEVDFYIVREGLDVKVFVYHSNFSVGGECLAQVPGSMPSIVTLGNKNAPLVFGGKVGQTNFISTVNDVWIADNIGFDDLPLLIANNRHSRSFFQKQTLNTTNSFFGFIEQMLDEVGNVAFLRANFKARWAAWDNAAGQSKQDHWVDAPSPNNGFQTPDDPGKCLSLISRNEVFRVPNLNFTGNFTIGFWMQTNGEYNDTIQLANTSFKGMALNYNGSGLRTIGYDNWTQKQWNIPGFDKNKWHHIVIVKNGRYIGFWIDGVYNDSESWKQFTPSYISETGSVDLLINGGDSTELSNAVYLSSVKVVPYAMCHIPIWGKGTRTSYPFIDILK